MSFTEKAFEISTERTNVDELKLDVLEFFRRLIDHRQRALRRAERS